jgi:hypothetical protein
MTTYTHFLDLTKEAEPPADGILSRTIFQDDSPPIQTLSFSSGTTIKSTTLPLRPHTMK